MYVLNVLMDPRGASSVDTAKALKYATEFHSYHVWVAYGLASHGLAVLVTALIGARMRRKFETLYGENP